MTSKAPKSETPPNPVIRATPSTAYAGWTIREYRDGTFDATQVNGLGLTRGASSFADAVAAIRENIGEVV